MMERASGWMAGLLASDAPALPGSWAMQLGLTGGWALVLATLGAALAWRLPLWVRRTWAAALALWTALPGPSSPDYWLGLAFHAPSLSTMLLCGWLLARMLFPSCAAHIASAQDHGMKRLESGRPVGWGWIGAVVLLGYLLLLDTFAVLPVQLYAWGFGPALLLGMLALTLWPWVRRGKEAFATGPVAWIAPLVLLLFAVTRLPTGNVWDAVLDPWLWLAAHAVLLVRRFFK
jgi:hypothetical protein